MHTQGLSVHAQGINMDVHKKICASALTPCAGMCVQRSHEKLVGSPLLSYELKSKIL